jgi:hypothetical protein
MRKPIDDLIRCKHCWGMGLMTYCDHNSELRGDTPCTTQDYQVCPLNGRDKPKNKREGC